MARILAAVMVMAGALGCDDGAQTTPDPADVAFDAAVEPEPDMQLEPPPDMAPEPEPDAGPVTPPAGDVVQLAGDTGSGFVDGSGPQARFNGITCVALSADGATLYASDTFNGTVRAIDLESRAVSTLAGRPLELASFDGAAGAARLTAPRGCAATADALYIADGPTLRRVGFDGAVQTLAGQANEPGDVDGVGADARLGYLLHDLEPSADGALIYISDRSNDSIRVLTVETGEVSTLVGPEGGLNGPGGIQRVRNLLYVADTFDGEIVAVDVTTGRARVVASGLDAPQGLAVERGAIYAAGFDGALYRVTVTVDGVDVEVAMGVAGDNRAVDGPRAEARLGGAFAPPVLDGPREQLYYVDLASGGVRQIDTGAWQAAPLAGPEAPAGYRDGPDPRFDALYDVVPHGDGWIVSDPLNNAVRTVGADGAGGTLFGVPGAFAPVDGPAADARIESPVGLAWAGGRLYVADFGRSEVRMYDPADGAVSTVIDGEVLGPWGLGAGPDGSLWITEAERGGVFALRPDGALDEVAPAGRFDNPVDVAVDPVDGAVYVADAVRAAVYRLEPDGRAVPVVGQPGQTGVRDGDLSEALLGEPLGLTFAADGGLMVVDGGNHMVRRIDLRARTITRWLGHPTRHGGRWPGAAVPWDEATLERPQAVGIGADGALGVVNEYALTVTRPAP